MKNVVKFVDACRVTKYPKCSTNFTHPFFFAQPATPMGGLETLHNFWHPLIVVLVHNTTRPTTVPDAIALPDLSTPFRLFPVSVASRTHLADLSFDILVSFDIQHFCEKSSYYLHHD